MASGIGAGFGADMLQDVLRRKLQEQALKAQIANQLAQQGLQARGQDLTAQAASERVAQDDRDLGFRRERAGVEDQHYTEQAPLRMANVRLVTANAGNAENLDARTQAAQAAQLARDDAGRSFTAGENAKNRQNAVRIAGMRLEGQGGGAAPTQAQQNEVEDALKLIQQIRDDKARALSTGPLEGRGLGAVEDLSGYTRFGNLHKNLVGKLALAQAGKLKGQGQISDKERALLMQASTALTRTLSDEDYLNELAKIEAQFQRMLPGPRAAAAPVSAPAAAPKGSGFKVVEIK